LKRHVFARLVCGVWLVAGHARADKITDAEELFRRGKSLMAEKKDREACPLFEESHRLDPQMGTLLNLAICHENVGRIASAWGEFRAVEQLARAASREDRVKLAHDRAAKLEPRLAHIKLLVPSDARVPGMVVKIDGEAKGEALWPSIPVDAGVREIEVTAPGKRPSRSRVRVDDEGAMVTVTLPKLEDAPPAPPPTSGTTEAPDTVDYAANRSKKTTGFIASGVGAAITVAGAVFGGLAVRRDGDATKACPQPCIAGSNEANAADRKTDRALAFANVANVAIPLGIVGIAVGVFLVLTAGPTSSRTALVVGPSGIGGRW
jgi:hypothetical protein